MTTPAMRTMFPSLIAVASVLLLASGSLTAREVVRWPDDCLARFDAANLLVDLNIELLRSRSATLVLERWCRTHGMASIPRIVAIKTEGSARPPSADQLRRLRVSDSSQVRHRHVELRCGTHVLSRADNWYVPERLSAEMNVQLESTDTPFGKVIAPLQPVRRTIETRTLWSPMPSGWSCNRFESAADATTSLQIPTELFQVRALLLDAGGRPFSEVSEVYQGALLNFPAPAPASATPVPDDVRSQPGALRQGRNDQ